MRLRLGGTSTSDRATRPARPARTVTIDVAVILQLVALAGVVVFAGSFGARWAVLAASGCLFLVGMAAGGLRVHVTAGAKAPDNLEHMGALPEVVPGQWT